MGDRCYISLICKRSDFTEHFESLGFVVDKEFDEGGETVEAYDTEANYAHYEALTSIGENGAIFFGHHSEGGGYPANVFASDGKSVAWCQSCDDEPTAKIREDGKPEPGTWQDAIDYWKAFKVARDILVSREEGGPQ